jgi:hypothetical protein
MEVFAPDGSHRRSSSFGAPRERVSVYPVGILDDGGVVMATQGNVDFTTKDGAVRDTASILRYDVTGRLTDTLGTFPGSEAWVVKTQSGQSYGVSVSNRPFGRDLTVIPHRGAVIVGTADAPELTVLPADGSPPRTVRWEMPAVPVTAEDIAAYKTLTAEGWPAGMEARRDRVLARLENAPYPETKPAYSKFLVGSDGSLWVQRYSMRADGGGATFDIFEPSGARRGECTMPAQFTLAQVTGEYALGTWKDPDDVVHVRMYKFAGPR